jgi:hypothetical protein
MIWRAFIIGATIGIFNGVLLWVNERLQTPGYPDDSKPVR